MNRSGGHRVRSVARVVATPALLIVGAAVLYANITGAAIPLRVASVVGLVVGIGLVVVFDVELLRARRDHGAERAALAKSYASTYATHLRVTNPLAADAGPSTTAETTAEATADTTAETAGEAKPEQDAEPGRTAASAEKSSTTEAAASAKTVAGELTPVKPTWPTAAEIEAERELWAQIQDAPTVVDLIAWEEKARHAKGSEDSTDVSAKDAKSA